jgi:hypothetical protein
LEVLRTQGGGPKVHRGAQSDRCGGIPQQISDTISVKPEKMVKYENVPLLDDI